MKNTLKEDLFQPLDKVQRAWIRKPITIALTPLIIIIGALYGIIEFLSEWYEDCW